MVPFNPLFCGPKKRVRKRRRGNKLYCPDESDQDDEENMDETDIEDQEVKRSRLEVCLLLPFTFFLASYVKLIVTVLMSRTPDDPSCPTFQSPSRRTCSRWR